MTSSGKTDLPRHLLPPGSGNFGSVLQTRGVMGCYVIERREVPNMIYAADGGDYTAAQVRIAIGRWRDLAWGPPGGKRPSCPTCQHMFTNPVEPEAFFIAIPYRGDGDSLVVAVCRTCVRKIGSDGLLPAAIEHFKRVWPSAQVTGSGVSGIR